MHSSILSERHLDTAQPGHRTQRTRSARGAQRSKRERSVFAATAAKHLVPRRLAYPQGLRMGTWRPPNTSHRQILAALRGCRTALRGSAQPLHRRKNSGHEAAALLRPPPGPEMRPSKRISCSSRIKKFPRPRKAVRIADDLLPQKTKTTARSACNFRLNRKHKLRPYPGGKMQTAKRPPF